MIGKLAKMNNKKLYIIAGCNGADMTTASYTILPIVGGALIFDNSVGNPNLLGVNKWMDY